MQRRAGQKLSIICCSGFKQSLYLNDFCFKRFSRNACGHQQDKQNGAPWLFVGIGNPGIKFEGTRHNVGFEIVDALSQAENISLHRLQSNAYIGEGLIGGAPVVLAKPQTYANLIGESVAPLMEYYNVPLNKLLVMFDDMETRLAKLWLLPHGGHGNHQGLINLIAYMKGSRMFPRLRIGIGLPPPKMDPKAYVLQKFCRQEREMINRTVIQGVEVLRMVSTHGLEKAIAYTEGSKMAFYGDRKLKVSTLPIEH